MLRVHRSNRLDRLVDSLADRIGNAPLADPIAPELVVVHSQATQRWLSQQLSQRLGVAGGDGGVCANVLFHRPSQALHGLLASITGNEAEGADAWAPESLTWTILEVLPDLADAPDQAPLIQYLGKDQGAVEKNAYQLAGQLSELFDKYCYYRADWFLAWSDDRSVDELSHSPAVKWQSNVLREVCRRIGAPSPAARLQLARSQLREGNTGGVLPERVSFFGPEAAPAPFVELLGDLSAAIDVDLYVLCPSDKYWTLVHTKRDHLRSSTSAGAESAAEQLHRMAGNPLLASFGRHARDFQFVLEGAPGVEYEDHGADLFAAPLAPDNQDTSTALATLQSDVLHCRHRRGAEQNAEAGDPAPVPLLPDDDSIRVHSCHGPTRQVEVLRDVILDLLDRDHSLEPRDVIVMTPDVEAFAPLVSAVFSDGQLAQLQKRDGEMPAVLYCLSTSLIAAYAGPIRWQPPFCASWSSPAAACRLRR
jgi:exodeoxyribonuclease V gamma subunit